MKFLVKIKIKKADQTRRKKDDNKEQKKKSKISTFMSSKS